LSPGAVTWRKKCGKESEKGNIDGSSWDCLAKRGVGRKNHNAGKAKQ